MPAATQGDMPPMASEARTHALHVAAETGPEARPRSRAGRWGRAQNPTTPTPKTQLWCVMMLVLINSVITVIKRGLSNSR